MSQQAYRRLIHLAVAIVLCLMLLPIFFLSLAHAATATLAWTDPVPTPGQGVPDGHKIYRSTDAAVCDNASAVLPLFQTLTTMGASFSDPTVPNVNGKVCYEVTAYNQGGESGRSNRAVSPTTVNPPATPSGFTVIIVKP